MNEYFIKVTVTFYQNGGETQIFFINANSGKDAYEEVKRQINDKYNHPLSLKELTGIELITIRRL